MNKDLLAKLEAKQEEEFEAVRILTEKNLNNLSSDLESIVKKNLTIIEVDMGHLGRAYLKPLKAVILFLIITCGGTWGMMQYYSHQIISKSQELGVLEKTSENFSHFKAVRVQKISGKTYLVFDKKINLLETNEGKTAILMED